MGSDTDRYSDADADLRLTVIDWVLNLEDNGPPESGVFDPFRQTLFARIADTTVWIEYKALPYLEPPVIAIRRYL